MSKTLSVPAWGNAGSIPKLPAYKQTRAWVWGRQTWLGDISRASKKFCREMAAWASAESVALPSLERLAQSTAFLQERELTRPDSGMEDAPIFLLSTGWRAGSTLLQRILVTDKRLLLWGEPLGEMAIVSKIAGMLADLISPALLREWASQANAGRDVLSTSWIANLYPPANEFRIALRSLFDQWLAQPASERGFSRWGFKEVRLGATEASLLHWLYPNAKFLLIYRHPYRSYRSLADSHWQFYYRYPDVPINSAASFACLWNQLVLSWSKLSPEFPCMRIKYEDLVSGKVDFRKLEAWLGITINENAALSVPIGGTAKRKSITWYERMIIRHDASEGMRALGYAA